MIREDRYKFIYYVNQEPQLFDLKEDPEEINDLANNPDYDDILSDLEKELRTFVNPIEIDKLAKKDQEEMIEAHGGKESILEEGFKIPFSPVPEQFR